MELTLRHVVALELDEFAALELFATPTDPVLALEIAVMQVRSECLRRLSIRIRLVRVPQHGL